MNEDLRDSVVLISGGAAGLGLAITRRFICAGARVVVLDRSTSGLQALKQEFTPQQLVGIAGDVRSLESSNAAVALAVNTFGRLDTFIGNAAIWDFGMSLMEIPVEAIGEAFEEMFAVNVKGYLFGARAAVPELLKVQGSIILTLSNAALYPGGGGPLYVSSKHACLGLTKELAYELAPKIRVNAVAPTGMPTDLSGPQALSLHSKKVKDLADLAGFQDRVPLGFLPEPSDYADAYLFLASRNAARTMTGAVVACDMGLGIRGIKSIARGNEL